LPSSHAIACRRAQALAVLAVMLRRLDFKMARPDEFPGMKAAATIHTKNGLMCTVGARHV
jgi:hypothetical protein